MGEHRNRRELYKNDSSNVVAGFVPEQGFHTPSIRVHPREFAVSTMDLEDAVR